MASHQAFLYLSGVPVRFQTRFPSGLGPMNGRFLARRVDRQAYDTQVRLLLSPITGGIRWRRPLLCHLVTGFEISTLTGNLPMRAICPVIVSAAANAVRKNDIARLLECDSIPDLNGTNYLSHNSS